MESARFWIGLFALFLGVVQPGSSIAVPRPPSRVIVYPAAEGAPLSTDYVVFVEGKRVPVYTAGVETRGKAGQDHPYYFCYFDLDGEARISVRSDCYPLDSAILAPNPDNLPTHPGPLKSLNFTVKKPGKITVMPRGFHGLLRVLHIFINPVEAVPQGPRVRVLTGTPPVVDRLHVDAGETLYVAGGAFIRANVTVKGPGARILGRGIIDFGTWPHFEGPAGGPFHVDGTDPKNPVIISGIILRHGWRATVSTAGSGIIITNVKIMSSSVVNDDPIWNSASDVIIRDVFIRGDDDCIGIKGDRGDVRNVSVRQSQLWSDRARNIIIGPESQGEVIEDIEFVDLDLYRHVAADDNSNEKCPGCYAICLHAGGRSFDKPQRIKNVRFADLRITSEKYQGRLNLIEVKTVVQERWGVRAPGIIEGPVVFQNIHYQGDPHARILIAGYDAEHPVGHVTFSDIWRNGIRVGRKSPGVLVGGNTSDIFFPE